MQGGRGRGRSPRWGLGAGVGWSAETPPSPHSLSSRAGPGSPTHLHGQVLTVASEG